MEDFHHRFSDLFRQLGLSADVESIRRFLVDHSPLAAEVALEDAPFWSQAQSSLIRERMLLDADWVEIVDQLNIALRTQGKGRVD